MKYRKFGALDWEVSALGFGCMRLPTRDGSWTSPNVDEPAAIHAIREAIEAGVNYLDTAYPYHGGQSELIVGRALRNGYRAKVRLATKSPTWLLQEPEDFDRYLQEQLTRLQTDQIDFYLLHGLNRGWWRDIILKHKILPRAERALRDGRIAHLGFSFHDDSPVFDEILDGSDLWSFCQIQYNYLDIENQAGTRGLRRASARGLAVVVMEPLLGGRLAAPPAAVQQAFEEAAPGRSAVDWALQWLWDQPEVATVLGGMSNLDQVKANLRSAENARVGSLSAHDQTVIQRVRAIYQGRTQVPCTKCGYCLPCPSEVNIPACFEIFNGAFLHGDVEGAKTFYRMFLRDGIRGMNASACVGCRDCESRCPQHIEISSWMPRVHSLLGAPQAAA